MSVVEHQVQTRQQNELTQEVVSWWYLVGRCFLYVCFLDNDTREEEIEKKMKLRERTVSLNGMRRERKRDANKPLEVLYESLLQNLNYA